MAQISMANYLRMHAVNVGTYERAGIASCGRFGMLPCPIPAGKHNAKPNSDVNKKTHNTLYSHTQVDKYHWPSRSTCTRWRRACTWICQVQIGLVLSMAHWRAERGGDNIQTLIGDGTSKNHTHLEAFIIKIAEGEEVAMVPFPTATKHGDLVATKTMDAIIACLHAYTTVWETLGPMPQLLLVGKPATLEQVMQHIRTSVSDHAGNEKTRISALEVAIRLLLDDATFKVERLFCVHHKIGCLLYTSPSPRDRG